MRTRLLGFVLLCVLCEAGFAQPATKPSQLRDPVAEAVRVLTKEAREAIRLKKPFPRSQSDYFKTSPAKVDVVKLFEALIRPGANATVDGYVKWQLISILPERLTPQFERAGTKALLLAPPIAPLPGTTSATRDELAKRIESLERDQLDEFNRSHASELNLQRERSAVIIRYRSEFSAKLPLAEQCLKARLDELWARGACGYDIEAESTILLDDIRAWKSQPDQIKQMAATVLDYANRPQPTIFDHVEWKPEESRPIWISRKTGFDPADLRQLAIELDFTLANEQK